jgi:hypothetical protein
MRARESERIGDHRREHWYGHCRESNAVKIDPACQ